MNGDSDAVNATDAELLGAWLGTVVKLHNVIEMLLARVKERIPDREESNERVVDALETLEVGLRYAEMWFPWPRPPVEILHIVREAQELQLATLQRWSILRDGFTRLRANDVGAAQAYFDASAPWALRQHRALDTLALMLKFLERDDGRRLDKLMLDEGAKDILGLGQQALGPPPRTEGPYACYWTVVLVPGGQSPEAAEKMPSLLLTSPVGSRAEALCQELAVSSEGGHDQYREEISEFTAILTDCLTRLVEPRPDNGDLLSALASVILGRVVDLSATNTREWASGPYPWYLYYPTIGVDLSVPRADNQWYLLPWPERAVLLRALKDHLNWSQIHFSSMGNTNGIHADVLVWGWMNETSGRPDAPDFANLPDPTDPRFGQLLRELDAIAAERDHELAAWERRVREKVGSS